MIDQGQIIAFDTPSGLQQRPGTPLVAQLTGANVLQGTASPTADGATIALDGQGQLYLQDAKVTDDELLAKLQAVTASRGGQAAPIYFRADRELKYGMIMRLLGRLNSAGYVKVELVTDFQQGS